jgi:hypothetical protein
MERNTGEGKPKEATAATTDVRKSMRPDKPPHPSFLTARMVAVFLPAYPSDQRTLKPKQSVYSEERKDPTQKQLP